MFDLGRLVVIYDVIGGKIANEARETGNEMFEIGR